MCEPETVRCVGSAVFEDKFRYQLSRIWDEGARLVTWLMFNPSAADHALSDPTLNCIILSTRKWGFGGLHVVNLFPLCGAVEDVGQWWNALDEKNRIAIMSLNDQYIAQSLSRSSLLLCAWGVDLPKRSYTGVKGKERLQTFFKEHAGLEAKYEKVGRVACLSTEPRHRYPHGKCLMPDKYVPYDWKR